MTRPAARHTLNPQTIDMVARELHPESWRTPRQIEQALPLDLSRVTVRTALRQLAASGRAEAKGDIEQRFYRAVK